MKKNSFLLLLSLIILVSSITYSGYIHVSGNTFTIPSDNEENNSYHTYNIDKDKNNNNTNTGSTYNNNNSNNIYNKNNNNNNSGNIYNKKYSSNNNSDNKNYNTTHNNKYKPKNNNSKNNKSSKKNNQARLDKSQPVTSNTITNKTTAPPYINSNKTKTRKNKPEKTKINTITKIEFKKHFIKIPAGSSENISFTTTPDKTSGLNFIYKSNDNSVATFKNRKLTGIKKGFTIILITLPDNTVKSACPVKVI